MRTLPKTLVLGLLNGLAVWALPILVADRQYGLLAALALGVAVTDYVFLAPRTYPLRYLLPGFAMIALMVVYPIAYTVYVAFTNYGDGHIITKQMVIDQYARRYVLREDLPTYQASFFRNETGAWAVLLAGSDGTVLVGAEGEACPLAGSDLQPVDEDGDGVFDRLGDRARVGTLQLFSMLGQVQDLAFAYKGAVLRMRGPQEFASYVAQYGYDPGRDELIDIQTGKAYRAIGGSFTSADGSTLDIGYKAGVGWRNFRSLVTDRRVARPFLQVFTWTVVWATLSVLGTFALGLFLAVVLNDRKLRFHSLYRVLLVIPYALPAFISALIWRGLFNTEVGHINSILTALFGRGIPWFQHPVWAKVAVLVVNLWLGFPYMMLISLGGLQAIPGELYEAATVDGASGWHQFWRITLPLLLVTLVPLLIASFAFNFNNFTVIYLVTEGRPPIAGASTPTGATDILISYTYRIAFEGGAGRRDYGLASAVSMLIFLIVGAISWCNFRFTRALEEVRENE